MDREFLTKMSESFCNDHTLYNSQIWESRDDSVQELNQYLVSLMTSLRITAESQYVELFDLSRQRQYELTYSLLEQYVNETYPDNELFETVDEDIFMIETGVTIGLAIAGGIAIAALVRMSAIALSGPWRKTFTKYIISISDVVNNFQKYVEQKEATSRVSNTLFYNRYEICSKQCRIGSNPGQAELSSKIRLTVTSKAHRSDPEAMKQFSCLFKCFVKLNIAVGRRMFDELQKCNSGTGISINHSIETILNKPEQMAAQCSVYYDFLHKHFTEYKNLINDMQNVSSSDKQILIVAYFKGDQALRSIQMFK